jgi:predicted porin
MKRTVLLLLLAAGVMPCYAQSSVTLWGIVDTNVAHGSGSISKKTQLSNSGFNSSQLGFRGQESFGDQMAGFWLEASVASDDGRGSGTNTNNQSTGASPALAGGQGLTFNRRSTVSIGGQWGELRFGRDYSPQFWNLTVFDPYSTLGVGTSMTLINAVTLAPVGTSGPVVRASNSITYLYGHAFNSHYAIGNEGFSAAAQYYLGENPSNAANSKDGTGYGVRVGYQRGPFYASVATSQTTYLVGDVRQSNVGASYDFGVAKVMGQYASDKSGALRGKGFLIGATVPVGPGMVRASYSTYENAAPGNPSASKIALGYVYNFSKRTAVYTTVASVKNSGGAVFALNGSTTAPNMSSRGFDVGLRHAF